MADRSSLVLKVSTSVSVKELLLIMSTKSSLANACRRVRPGPLHVCYLAKGVMLTRYHQPGQLRIKAFPKHLNSSTHGFQDR